MCILCVCLYVCVVCRCVCVWMWVGAFVHVCGCGCSADSRTRDFATRLVNESVWIVAVVVCGQRDSVLALGNICHVVVSGYTFGSV